MSRNGADCPQPAYVVVTSRKGRVSRNDYMEPGDGKRIARHVPQGACE